MKWVRAWWYKRLRKIDIELLWPICKARTLNLSHARAAFALHAFHDKAWLILGSYEMARIINDLK